MNRKKSPISGSIRRGIRVFLPFFLLLLGFITFSVVNQQSNRVAKGNEDEDLSTPLSSNAKGTNNPNEIVPNPTASKTSQPTIPSPGSKNSEPVPTTLPTRFPNGAIQLKGPPPESIFPMQTPLTIYWDWPHDIEENHLFFVYLLDDSGEYLVGSAAEPSLGNHGYQLNFVPADTINLPGTYQIEIRLEQKETRFVFASSNPRILILTQAVQG